MKDLCLIYFGQLCEDNFAVNFGSKNIFLQKGKHIVIGYRDATTGLYLVYFDNPKPPPCVANNYNLA